MDLIRSSRAIQPQWRGRLRFALGRAQMLGSVVTLILLIQQGVNDVVVWGVVLTGLVTALSFVLFHFIWPEPRKG